MINRLLIISFCFFVLQQNSSAQESEIQLDFGESGDVLSSALMKSAEEAYNLNMKGLDALEADNLDDALDYFKKAIEVLPNYSDAINNCGVVYFRRGNVILARETWQKVTKIDPKYAIAFHNLGIIEFNDKKYDAAKQYFLQALDVNKRLVDALVMLGRAELLCNARDAALDYLQKAYKIDPSHQGAWAALAYCLIMSADTAGAEAVLRKNLKSPHALRMLGEIEAVRGHADNAVNYLTESAAKGGGSELLLSIAQIQLDEKRCPDALSTLDSYFKRVSNPSSDAWLLAGLAAKDCGRLKETQRYFEQGVKYYPHDQLLLFNLGQVYFYQNDYSKADDSWSALSDTINDPSLFFLRAVAAKKLGRLADAENSVRRALSLNQKAEYYDLLGTILHAKGDKRAAVDQFKKALSIDPLSQSAQLNLAVSEGAEKNLSDAVTVLKKQLGNCTTDCTGMSLRLSILYYHSKQYENAIKTLETVPPGNRDLNIYRHLAIYYKATAQWDKAILSLETARKKVSLDTDAENVLADAYLEAGFYSKAILFLNSLLLKREDDLWRLYYQLGYAFLKQNDPDNAEKFLKKSLEEKTDNPAAQSHLAFVYKDRGDDTRARELWKETQKSDPDNPAILINLALTHEKEGDYAKALEIYQKVLLLGSVDNAVYLNIGTVYENMKDSEKALDAYKRALDSPKRATAAYNIFNIEKNRNEKRPAQKMYELLKKEFPNSVDTKRVSGEMLLWQKDTSAACAAFEAIPDKNHEDWATLAHIYCTLGKNSKAFEALKQVPDTMQWKKVKDAVRATIAYNEGKYTEAMTIWKQNSDTAFEDRYNLAVTAYNAREYSTALQIATVLAPRAPSADKAAVYTMAGESAVKLKDWETARRWYEKLCLVKQDDAVVYLNLAVAEYNLNNVDQAWNWYEKAQKINPAIQNTDIENRYKSLHEKPQEKYVIDTLDSVYNVAVELQNSGKEAAAEGMYKQIVAQDPRHYRAWNNLGAIYSARGELEPAIDCFKNAVSRKADIADGYANLVNIYIALEDYKNAQKWLDRGFRFNPDSEVLQQMEEALKKAKK